MNTVYSVSENVKVKNENGTSKRPACSCGSWLEHWENYSGKIQTKCSIKDCDELAEVGAHITRPNAKNADYKTHSYILPMCTTHNNQRGEILTTKKNCTFVWANVKETCDKENE